MRVFLFFVVVLTFISCKKETKNTRILQGNAFGTTYSIQYYSPKEFKVQQGLDSVLAAVNASVSTYMPNSAISKINRGDSTVVVDRIFKEVFIISEEVHRNSLGYFDPTVGVLRNAYGFGEEKPLKMIDSTVLDSLRKFVGFQKVQITPKGTIEKEYPEIYFDFKAVAKGYGIDCIGRYLNAQGVSDYLIELGGEILAKGRNLDKQKPWVVGIEGVDSSLEDRTYTHTIAIENMGMASSGNYRKYRIDSLTGKKYVHTINPLTGKAEASNVTSATVTAKTCALADAYATACMAMGLDKAKQMLENLEGVEAYLTYLDEQQETQSFATEGFQKLLFN